jgi:5-methylcytosine-specific restriction endonuclease McrA
MQYQSGPMGSAIYFMIGNSQVCKNCKHNLSNPGRSWCEQCYQNQQKNHTSQNSTIEEFQVLVSQIESNMKNGKYINQYDNIPSTLRSKVWVTYASEIYRRSKCFCCRSNEIEESNFECGHVISRRDGGPVCLDNLRPICSQCNRSMNTKNMCIFINQCGFWNSKSVQPQELPQPQWIPSPPQEIQFPQMQELQFPQMQELQFPQMQRVVPPQLPPQLPPVCDSSFPKYSLQRMTIKILQKILEILKLNKSGTKDLILARIVNNKDKFWDLTSEGLNEISSLIFHNKVAVTSDNKNEVISHIISGLKFNPNRILYTNEYTIILDAMNISTDDKHCKLSERLSQNISKLQDLSYKTLKNLGTKLELGNIENKDQIITQITKMIKC